MRAVNGSISRMYLYCTALSEVQPSEGCEADLEGRVLKSESLLIFLAVPILVTFELCLRLVSDCDLDWPHVKVGMGR